MKGWIKTKTIGKCGHNFSPLSFTDSSLGRIENFQQDNDVTAKQSNGQSIEVRLKY